MFKKFKDKLAEEVKSSPQRIQQFAQAAQAAVNSASSSITDITNNDLFSIGENDTKTGRALHSIPGGQVDTFQSVPLMRSNVEAIENDHNYDNHRVRRLSNSSFTSDVSFKLPSYESSAMYHLQSDMDVSASEAEDRSLPLGGAANLEHVTKEQLYSAYRRTKERYSKYRSQYAELARHYRVLERDSAKAKSVLVETQDKALRRISELREQCSLEQSAKAHLESALRVELDEKNMKLESLTTKINLLQDSNVEKNMYSNENHEVTLPASGEHLIDLADDSIDKPDSVPASEVNVLNNKLEKMEHLLNKYKESVKSLKDRNSQLTSQFQVLNNNFEINMKENEELKSAAERLILIQQEMQILKDLNEELQNKLNTYDFNKVKEIASLDSELKQAKDEVGQLTYKIESFNKKEEEYAISLAENKLSIHKELEGKETEINSLKDSLSVSMQEIQSLNIIVNSHKQTFSQLEEDKVKLNAELIELHTIKDKFTQLEEEVQDLKTKTETQEALNNKLTEEIQCLELQSNQETAEKLAMIDRNEYLENRIKQISQENSNKNEVISKLEIELLDHNAKTEENLKCELTVLKSEKSDLINQVNTWKNKYVTLETEIHDERVELVKLQSEIEKLLRNHERIQLENSSLNEKVSELHSECSKLQKIKAKNEDILQMIVININEYKSNLLSIVEEIKILQNKTVNDAIAYIGSEMSTIVKNIFKEKDESTKVIQELQNDINEIKINNENLVIKLTEANNTYIKAKINITKLENDNQIMGSKMLQNNKNLENQKVTLEENETIRKQLNEILITRNEYENKYLEIQSSHDILSEENNVLLERCELLKQEKESLYEKVLMSEQKCQEVESCVKSLQNQLLEKEILLAKFSQLEEDLQEKEHKLQELLKMNKEAHNTVESTISILDSEISTYEPSAKSDVKDLCQSEYEITKQDNKRLLSEIEGLQIHLQKVAKDNTALNDQLRDTIAHSESFNFNDKIDQIAEQEINNLKQELQEEKQKQSDLLRENSILAEKNLELQDCIKLHHHKEDHIESKKELNSSNKQLEIKELQAKYNGLLNIKIELESKLAELELMGRSGDKNVQHLEEKNDRLQLCNEKLERKLDEALVSLRHLRALEENTELEYLRNILYEYFTGSGSHSETLAKVISAVIKFDKNQTQMVLNKEKERQGLLKQLGLL